MKKENKQAMIIVAVLLVLLFLFANRPLAITSVNNSTGSNGGGGSSGNSGSGGNGNNGNNGDGGSGGNQPTIVCSDSDNGYDIWTYGVVDVPRMAVMYPDSCIDGRYLHEWDCINNVAKLTTVDCFMSGAICNQGACTKPTCSQILRPTDQSSCDRGTGCDSSDYCKFIPATSTVPSRCACTAKVSKPIPDLPNGGLGGLFDNLHIR